MRNFLSLLAVAATPVAAQFGIDADEELAVMMTLRMLQSNATNATVTNTTTTTTTTTVAVTTAAPATDAPATNAPATDAPATDAPATDAPVTDAPATDAPVTPKPDEKGPPQRLPKNPDMWAAGLPKNAAYKGCKNYLEYGMFSDNECTKPLTQPMKMIPSKAKMATDTCALVFMEGDYFNEEANIIMPVRMAQMWYCVLETKADMDAAGRSYPMTDCHQADLNPQLGFEKQCEAAKEGLAASMVEENICEEGEDRRLSQRIRSVVRRRLEDVKADASDAGRGEEGHAHDGEGHQEGGDDEEGNGDCWGPPSAGEYALATSATGLCMPADEGMFILYKVGAGTCASDSVEAAPAAAAVAVEITMSIEVDIDMSEDDFAAAMTSADPSDPVVAALQKSLIDSFADAMNLPEDAEVTIISIKFVDAERRMEEADAEAADDDAESDAKLGAGKKMVVEYEITGVTEDDTASLEDAIADSAADITSALQAGVNEDIASNTVLAAAVAPVVVDAEIPEPVVTVEDDTAPAPADDSTSGASGLKESAGVLLVAAALSASLF